MVNNKLPSYTQDNLALVRAMTSQIVAAAARYGVPPEAIAGALAQEQLDQKASLMNYGRMVGSAVLAREFLDRTFIDGKARNRFHPTQGASDIILDRYNADPNAITVGQDRWKKVRNPLLVDYGPAGMKLVGWVELLRNPSPGKRCRQSDLMGFASLYPSYGLLRNDEVELRPKAAS